MSGLPVLWTSTRTSGTAAHLALAASGLDAEVRFISLRAGDHRRPDYLAINPKGEVPALQLAGGGTITEIPAIMCWLAEAAPDGGLLPAGQPGRAHALEWLAWCHFHMANPLWVAFQAGHAWALDESAAQRLREMALERWRADLDHAERALAGRDTLLGTGWPTAPDLFLFTLLRLSSHLGVDTGAWPNLERLSRTVAGYPPVAAALAREDAA